jgi:hypothetical protein
VWCLVALALYSPALPVTPSPAPSSLPPSGTTSTAPSPSTAPTATSGQATTPSPVSTQSTAAPQSSAPSLSGSAGVTPVPGAQPGAPPAPVTAESTSHDVPVTPPDTDPTRFHFAGRGTLASGIGSAGRFDTVTFGDPAGDHRSHGYLVHNTGAFTAWLRAVGYAERQAKKGSPLFFILPDIALSFQLGGSVVSRDALAIANGHDVYRRGTYLGVQGHGNISGGVATSGRFGVYGKGGLGVRYQVGGASPEGNYGLLPVGLGAGLRVGVRPNLTVLVGPKLDVVLGVQGIGGWSRMTQLAPGGDLVIQARTKRDVYVGVLATADVTALGRTHGGQRIFGRTTIDVGIPMTPGLRMSLFATYSGWRATATPNSSQFAPEGQTWGSHSFVMGVGIGL